MPAPFLEQWGNATLEIQLAPTPAFWPRPIAHVFAAVGDLRERLYLQNR